MAERKVIEVYGIERDGVKAQVSIVDAPKEYVKVYELNHTKIKDATAVALSFLKEKIIENTNIKISEILDPRSVDVIKARLIDKAHELIEQELSGLDTEEENVLVGRLVQEMLGLGEIELILSDEALEEIVINSNKEPVWVYHKFHGWLRTNVYINSEEQIHNYASIIGRKVGRQITNLDPLMDARLLTGDRVNATLFPVSTKGNGITIRKFAKDPWTIVKLIDNNTLSAPAAALFWLALQYETNTIVGGGTASGKTSFLNSVLVFTPANQRIVSIEDTQELQLPEFVHWTPLLTRQPNPEGKGEITMLDLMVNSLRMRPDRIVLGETRRQREAEVLFEAMHTGHAVYSTLHADTAEQVKRRLVGPPINIPEPTLEALQLIVIQYRQRRTGKRRTYEVAEIMPKKDGSGVDLNLIYKWDARTDQLKKVGEYKRLLDELELHSGFNKKEVLQDLDDKENILKSLLSNKIFGVEPVGRVVAEYYKNPDAVLNAASKNKLALWQDIITKDRE